MPTKEQVKKQVESRSTSRNIRFRPVDDELITAILTKHPHLATTTDAIRYALDYTVQHEAREQKEPTE